MGRTTSSPSSPAGEGGFGFARRVQFAVAAAVRLRLAAWLERSGLF